MRFVTVLWRRADRFEMSRILVNVLADRRCQVLGGSRFGGREQPGPYSLGSSAPGRRAHFEPLTCPGIRSKLRRRAVAVTIAGDVCARLVADSLGPVLSGRHGRRFHLALAVAPSSEPHPLPSDDLGVRR